MTSTKFPRVSQNCFLELIKSARLPSERVHIGAKGASINFSGYLPKKKIPENSKKGDRKKREKASVTRPLPYILYSISASIFEPMSPLM